MIALASTLPVVWSLQHACTAPLAPLALLPAASPDADARLALRATVAAAVPLAAAAVPPSAVAVAAVAVAAAVVVAAVAALLAVVVAAAVVVVAAAAAALGLSKDVEAVVHPSQLGGAIALARLQHNTAQVTFGAGRHQP